MNKDKEGKLLVVEDLSISILLGLLTMAEYDKIQKYLKKEFEELVTKGRETEAIISLDLLLGKMAEVRNREALNFTEAVNRFKLKVLDEIKTKETRSAPSK